jgi:polyhydroxyalkanoate synthesis repressor PhaR
MESPIIFKKYANRRLYNTATSKYVTIGDLSDLISQGKQVKVIEDKTNIDVTAFTLTQIILEQAKGNNVLLPVPILHMIIQYGNNILLDFFTNYLTQIIQNYIAYKRSVDEQFQQWLELGMGLSQATTLKQPPVNPFQSLFAGYPGVPQGGPTKDD